MDGIESCQADENCSELPEVAVLWTHGYSDYHAIHGACSKHESLLLRELEEKVPAGDAQVQSFVPTRTAEGEP